MLERVSIIDGKSPVIYVAPHGNEKDDLNTDLVTETLAKITNGYAVINRGWERSANIDYKKEKANCNNVEHCYEDVVKEEFLNPIIRFKNRILKKWSRVFVIYLHGMSNEIQNKTGISNLNYVVGWGNGRPASHTCQRWIKDFLIYNLAISDNCVVAEGKSGGNFAAWSKKNMSQFFRKWHPDNEIDSVQIEIINKIRYNDALAEVTAHIIAIVVQNLLKQNEDWKIPSDYNIPQV